MAKRGRPRGKDPFYAPPWSERFDQLRRKKLTYDECARLLNAEGHKSVHGKPISVDHIRAWVYNRKGR